MQKLDEHSPQYLRFDLLINFCELSIDEFFMTFNWCVCVFSNRIGDSVCARISIRHFISHSNRGL